MLRFCMQALLAVGLTVFSFAESVDEKEEAQIPYEMLEIKKSIFGDFSMLMQERDEYATTICRFALEDAHEAPQEEGTMLEVRKLIGLALHLSPRNRTAVVANHQLGRNLLPEKKEADYSRSVFARLLLTRGRLLKKQENEGDQLVGRCFVALAASLDPRNEDAIYEYEIQRLEEKAVDWSLFGG